VADPDSVLAAYGRLLAFRRTSFALQRGEMKRIDSGDPDVLAWMRGSGDETLLILVSFLGEERAIDLGALAGGRWAARVGTHRELPAVDDAGRLSLRPDEAVILGRASR
jgi:glycosidase